MTHHRDDDPGFAVPLSDAARGALTFQRYDAQPAIGGVRVVPLRKHRAINGWFTELFRITDGIVDGEAGGGTFAPRQISAAHAEPGRINAFHIHPNAVQDEIWTVVHGALLVWLVDCRRDSSTSGVMRQVFLSAEEPALLFIPAGVAHGYRAGRLGGLLVYAMSQQFDHDDPNEGRLPWDHFGAEIWEEDLG